MSEESTTASDRVLDPMDRISEVIFGLIMVLTYTSSLSVAADNATIRALLLGAVGCNLAWGIIDAGMYLMARLNERGRNNFPQTYSMAGLILTAMRLSRSWEDRFWRG
jgi:hypothetical protein